MFGWNGGYHNVNFGNSAVTETLMVIQFHLSLHQLEPQQFTNIFTTLGSYTYDCSVGSHAAAGMVGSIEVVNSDCNRIAK